MIQEEKIHATSINYLEQQKAYCMGDQEEALVQRSFIHGADWAIEVCVEKMISLLHPYCINVILRENLSKYLWEENLDNVPLNAVSNTVSNALIENIKSLIVVKIASDPRENNETFTQLPF